MRIEVGKIYITAGGKKVVIIERCKRRKAGVFEAYRGYFIGNRHLNIWLFNGIFPCTNPNIEKESKLIKEITL